MEINPLDPLTWTIDDFNMKVEITEKYYIWKINEYSDMEVPKDGLGNTDFDKFKNKFEITNS